MKNLESGEGVEPFAALKIESQNMDGGSAIKLEVGFAYSILSYSPIVQCEALRKIHVKTTQPHVPQLFKCRLSYALPTSTVRFPGLPRRATSAS